MAIDPRRINREMRGFLDLVRAKVGGRQPDQFDGSIRTVIDGVPFLAASQMVTKSASQTATTAADVEIDVPDDEAWLVYQASAHWEFANTGAATQSAQGYLAFGNVPTAGGGGTADAILKYWSASGTLVDTVTQARGGSAVYVPPGHFILPPSSSVKNVTQSKVSTVNLTTRVYCLYTPLSV